MTDEDRIARLEQAVEELRREVAALRGERGAAATPSPTPHHEPTRASTGESLVDRAARLGLGPIQPRGRVDVEAVVGRYGTVALAALLILMGVGAFLTWAIARYTIGPRLRVALGVVVAAALAGLGWRVRRGWGGGRDAAGEAKLDAHAGRRYGDVLIGLALAVVHVDAWGAGPYLALISSGTALAIAAAASAGLALLAWTERDQPLFVVGVGGALVAPFVTSAGPGHPFVLPTYGWLVLTTGALALPRDAAPRRTRWPFAARMLGIGGAAYAAAMIGDATRWSSAAAVASARGEVPALFAVAAAGGALVLGGATAGPWLALAHVTTTAAAVLALALDVPHGATRLVVIAAVADALTYAALWRVSRAAHDDGARVDVRVTTTALLLPLALLVAALVALPNAVSDAGAGVGAVWAALALGAAAIGGAPPLGASVAVAGLASALVPAFLLRGEPVARAVALAAHATLFAAVFARVRRRLALVPPLAVLAATSLNVYLQLWERRAFAYTPFLTGASLAAAAVTAAWIALAWLVWRACVDLEPGCEPVLTTGERGALAATAAVVALLWGREELARAVSPDVATFLLVGYFAAAGIVAILTGRARRVPAARQAGLALALYAAFKALVQASSLDPVGLRVGSYLVVGGFLLGVGWWYRAAGHEPAREEAP